MRYSRKSNIIPIATSKRPLPRSWFVLGILALVALAITAYRQLQTASLPAISIFTPSAYRVIDGDTVDAPTGVRYRLLGYDTPETYRAICDEELALGKRATERLKELLASGEVQLIESGKTDRYGRSLARLTVDGNDVGQILIGEGLARPYYGGRHQGWCP